MLKMSRNCEKSMLKVSVRKMFDKRYLLFGFYYILQVFFTKAVYF